MLEGELDVERGPPQAQTRAQAQQNESALFQKRFYLMVGITCIINFIASLDCNYKTSQYLVINSILFTIFAIYVVRKQMNLELFAIYYLLTVGVIYAITLLIYAYNRMFTSVCDPKPKCPICEVCEVCKIQTNSPTIFPTLNYTG
jgi:hypothetical protein